MKNCLLLFHVLFLVSYCSFSQGVGIGTVSPDASGALDISATNKGLLIPRMSLTAINAIINPARGLLVYDSAANQLMSNTGSPVAPNWQPVGSGRDWNLTGNSGINPTTQFIGTTDNQPLRFRVNNILAGELQPATGNIFWGLRAGQASTIATNNVAIGTDALKSNTIISDLVAIGDSALLHNGEGVRFPEEGTLNTAIGAKSLFSNTTGSQNTAIGANTLLINTTGGGNTATGVNALRFNTTGFFNTASGVQSLFSNTTGIENSAIGVFSLASNTTGNNNSAIGFNALAINKFGSDNTAVGDRALLSNTASGNTAIGSLSLNSNSAGDQNTAIGFRSLGANTGGFGNTATGFQSLLSNVLGKANTATGALSLFSNTNGNNNTALGHATLFLNTTGLANTAVGQSGLGKNTTGNNNTAVGQDAMRDNTIGSSNVAIGAQALLLTIGSQQNTVVGFQAGSRVNMGFNNTLVGGSADIGSQDLFNCVALGQNARTTASNQVRLGNTFTTSIGGVVGYTNLSDGRYKKNIRETVKGIDFIMKLRPVTYQLNVSALSRKLNEGNGKQMDELSKKSMSEQEKTVFSGFVAQDVEKAANEVGYDFSGVEKPKNENDMYGLRYAEFVVPLVKAVQEQQQIINELRNKVTELEKKIK